MNPVLVLVWGDDSILSNLSVWKRNAQGKWVFSFQYLSIGHMPQSLAREYRAMLPYA